MGRWILFIWPLSLAEMLVDNDWLTLGLGAVFAVYVLGGLIDGSKSDRILGATAVSVGAGLLAVDQRLPALPAIFSQTVVFAAFVASAQLLRSLAASDPRIAHYKELLAQQVGAARPVWLTVGSAVMGSVMTVGAVAILSPLFAGFENGPQRRDDAVAALTGTGLAVNWSPFFVSMAVVSAFFHDVSFWKMMLLGFSLSSVGLCIALALLRAPTPGRTALRAFAALGGLLPVIAVAAATVVLLRFVGDFSTLQASCLAIAPLSFVLIYTDRSKIPARARLAQTARMTRDRIISVATEIAIIALAFFMGLVLRDSATLANFVAHLGVDALPPLLVLILVPLGMMTTGMLSVHPIVSASLLMAMMSGNSGVSDIALAGATLVGWSIASMVSYSGLLVMVTTSVSAVPRSQLILSRNSIFALAYAFVAAILLAAFNKATL